jgi:hypothetical protein
MARTVETTTGGLIGYSPTEYQREFHRVRKSHAYTVFLAHRRFGKTEACLAELISGCLTCPREAPNFKYIAPTLKQAKEIAWGPLMKMVSRMRANGARGIDVSRTDARVVFNCAVNAPAVLQFAGLEEPDNLRGGYDDGMIVDEAASMRPDVWGDILVPRLADRDGWAVITGTVKGMDQLYDFYCRGKEGSSMRDPHWASLYFPVSETELKRPGSLPWLSGGKLETLASGMGGFDSVSWRQEMELDWLASDGNLLVPLSDVRLAMGRGVPLSETGGEAHVMGLDTSGHGSDSTVMVRRKGRVVYPVREFREADSVYLASQVALEHRSCPLDAVFVDCTGGYGLGVVENVRRMLGAQTAVYEINFSSRASDPLHYVNKRSEMWDTMAKWIRSASLPAGDELLCKDLTNVRYELARGRLKLEDKEKVKDRLGRSPDSADALALTFAYPVAPASPFCGGRAARTYAEDGYEPMED